MPETTLAGCAPVPIAHYLKALGILRLVGEQADADVTGFWRNDTFVLRSKLDSDALTRFFSETYAPTPVVAPWNGGSGFFPKDNDEAVLAVENGLQTRLESYRQAIQSARAQLEALRLREKPDETAKPKLLQQCRNAFPEDALKWMDAVLVLSQSGTRYPPLLGTGGNDGRLEFTNNFMQRLVEVGLVGGASNPASAGWLRSALFGTASRGAFTRAPAGQFFPGLAGGPNATSGFDAESAINPWDFILTIEGSLLFAAASVKRLESAQEAGMAYPFCVRQSGIGYASAAGSDETESRCEMWMPLWQRPTGLQELRAILGEGRAQVRGRPARHGVDFTQAVVSLGVDRGIDAFQRFGFQVRNGLSYFATPLDRVVVRRHSKVDLLADLDAWYDRLRSAAAPGNSEGAPAGVRRCLASLERRILEWCRDDSRSRFQDLILTLGEMERALSNRLRWTRDEAGLQPLDKLRPGWLAEADDGTAEFRLARALASARGRFGSDTLWMREHLEPVEKGATNDRSWTRWSANPTRDVQWHDGEPVSALNAILSRRLIRAQQAGLDHWPDWSPYPASLEDIARFVEGRTDDRRLAEWLWALLPIDWERILRERRGTDEATSNEQRMLPSGFYAVLRSCFRPAGKNPSPIVPAIARRAMAGQGTEAASAGIRRLRASRWRPLVSEMRVQDDVARRTAASLLFPIGIPDFAFLENCITHKSIDPRE